MKFTTKELLLLIFIVLLGFFLRVDGVSSQSVWLDETISLHAAMTPIIDLVSFPEPSPPLYFITLRILLLLFGFSLPLFYAFSIILALASIVLVFFIGKELFSKKTGFYASLLFAVSPLFVHYTLELRSYTLFFFFTLLSVYALLRVMRSPKNSNWLFYFLSSLCLLYTHLYGVFVVAALAIFWLANKKKQNMSQWLFAQILLLVMFVPWLLNVFSMVGSDLQNWIPAPSLLDLAYLLYGFLTGPLLFFFWPLLAGILFLCAYMFFKEKNNAKSLLVSWLVLPIIIPLLFSLFFFPIFTIKYAFVALFPLFFIIGEYVQRFKPFFELTFILLFVIAGIFISLFQSHVQLKDNWSQAASFTESVRGQEVAIVAYYEAFPYAYHAYPQCFTTTHHNQTFHCLGSKEVYPLTSITDMGFIKNDNFTLVTSREDFSAAKPIISHINENYDLQLLRSYSFFQTDISPIWFDALVTNTHPENYNTINVYVASKK